MPNSLQPICEPAVPAAMPTAKAGLAAVLAACLQLLHVPVRAEPLTLEQAIREALGKSEEALVLKEKENRFEAVKQQAWSSAYPRISAYANAGRGASPFDLSSLGFQAADTYVKDKDGNLLVQNVNGQQVVPVDRSLAVGNTPTVIATAQNRYTYGIQADQTLFAFGRVGQVVKTANIQDRADRASRHRALQNLQLQVLDAYYEAVTLKARLGTLESALKRQTETVNFLEGNFRMGSGQRSNVLLAITSLKSLEPQRIRAEKDAETARMALNRILGRSLEAQVELDTATHLPMDAVKSLPDSQAMEALISERSDIKSMELQRQSLEGQARYLKMLYLPTLGAQGKVGVLAYKLDQLDELDDNREWQVGIGLNWQIFDGFSLSSQAKQMQSDARSLGINTRQARKKARIELEGVFREYQAADTALAASQQAVAAAQEAQALLSQDFRAGKGQLTDLLSAEESLRTSEFGLLNARYQQVRSAAALRLAMGKGLINEEAP
ncbi:MAG TPA: TolC family protein [Fibrobacteria bacterium]|nr:TolC family protein [Fibrobacteria bacterium]